MMMTLTGEEVVTRFHPRVEADFSVRLKANGRSMLTKASDLSMAGLRLLGNFVGIDARVTVSIVLPEDKVVTTGAKVKRVSQDETALEFDQLDWDDLMALARFLHPRLP